MKKKLLTVAGVALAAGMGMFAGGLAQAATVPEPAAPTFEVNEAGETFGSDLYVDQGEVGPDLIAVVATTPAGSAATARRSAAPVEGYVKSEDLKDATGETAMEGFTSPEEALAWQAGEGRLDQIIPVYAEDGTTVIGEYVVYGSDSQDRMTAEATEALK